MFSQSHVVAVNNSHDENSDIEKSSPSVSSPLAILTAVTCASSTPTSVSIMMSFNCFDERNYYCNTNHNSIAVPCSLNLNQLATIFGNGGMTATTPTLTPTTMKNIEEALQGHEEELNLPRPPIDHRHQGGFVPPTIDMSGVFTSISRSPPQLHLLHPSTMVVEQENVSNNFFRNNMPNGSNSVIVGHGTANTTSFSMSDEESSQDPDSDSFSNEDDGTFSQEGMDSNDSQQMSTLSSLSTSSNTASPRNTKRTKTAKSKPRKSSTNSRNKNSNERVTPEEELRRKLRRERNKLAAARCRKRRVDQTNQLLQETEKLEEETRRLKKELHDYERKCIEFEQFLHHHECRFANVKNNNINGNENRTSPHQQLSHQDNQNNNFIYGNNPVNNSKRPPRPSSLALGSAKRSANSRTSNNSTSSSSSSSLPPTSQNGDSLVTISTPSNGIFSLEGLEMTGLTPLLSTPSAGGFLSTPVSCGGQTRGDIPLSPDGVSSNKLVSL